MTSKQSVSGRAPHSYSTLHSRAAEGDSVAAATLAYRYRYGKGGLTKDAKRALEYNRLAASLGDSESAFNAGDMYDTGEGVARDRKQALRYYRDAARKKHPDALASLGVMYWYGEGMKRDRTKALQYYRKAARLGSPDALFNLGQAYTAGIGTNRNLKKAIKSLEAAAELGHVRAQYRTGEAYYKGDGTKSDRRLALRWLTKASRGGDRDAKALLKIVRASLSNGAQKQPTPSTSPSSKEPLSRKRLVVRKRHGEMK